MLKHEVFYIQFLHNTLKKIEVWEKSHAAWKGRKKIQNHQQEKEKEHEENIHLNIKYIHRFVVRSHYSLANPV